MQERQQSFFHSPLFLMIAGILVLTGIVGGIILLATNNNNYDPNATLSELSGSDLAPKLAIDNLAETLPDMPIGHRNAIEQDLLEQITKDVSKNTAIPLDGAKVRDNSLHTLNYEKYYVGDFIVDIEALHRSYRIFYQYGILGNLNVETFTTATFYCLEDKTEIIYADFTKCSAKTSFKRFTAETLKTFVEREKNTGDNS